LGDLGLICKGNLSVGDGVLLLAGSGGAVFRENQGSGLGQRELDMLQ
jgi:hypothetical protein